jgi:ATP-dependent Clp protease ATP-binding subunit ClpC
MFERFTERARQVVVLARDEAHELGHDYIGTEHLLLGLLREQEGVAGRALANLGVTLPEARARVRSMVPVGERASAGQLPFTPRAKRTLELSLREALAHGHNHIGTEHLLLGLCRDEEAIAARILKELGADVAAVREAVVTEWPTAARAAAGGEASIHVSAVPRRRMPLLTARPWPRREEIPRPRTSLPPLALLVGGWVLFALALGVGILIGWAIWG